MSVRLTPYTMNRIEYYQVNRGLNCHDTALIRGEMTEDEVDIFQSYLDSSTVLSLYYSDDEENENRGSNELKPAKKKNTETFESILSSLHEFKGGTGSFMALSGQLDSMPAKKKKKKKNKAVSFQTQTMGFASMDTALDAMPKKGKVLCSQLNVAAKPHKLAQSFSAEVATVAKPKKTMELESVALASMGEATRTFKKGVHSNMSFGSLQEANMPLETNMLLEEGEMFGQELLGREHMRGMELEPIQELELEPIQEIESSLEAKPTAARKLNDTLALSSAVDSGFEMTSMLPKDETLVFAGIVSNFRVLSVGETWYVEIEMTGITSQLDFARVKKDYQSESKTVSSIADGIFQSYSGTNHILNGKDETISDFLLQYEESDYHFLRRIMSRNNDVIYTNMRGQDGCICLGLPKFTEKEKLEPAKYELVFEKHLGYRIESDKFYDIGDGITAFGKSLFVKEVKLIYDEGEFINLYLLSVKEGMEWPTMVNEEAVGVSLDGTIKATERDKVQIELNGTPETPESERRWFAYASPAASSDGSGWYCMPKDGEEIRLYCPTEKEVEAYVISAIKSGDSGAGGGAGGGAGAGGGEERNTQDKILSNDAGQSVSFTDQGVAMNCADGSASVTLTPEGNIEILAMKDINISSATGVTIKSAQDISLAAGGTFAITNETGSDFTITGDIAIHGKRIRNNG